MPEKEPSFEPELQTSQESIIQPEEKNERIQQKEQEWQKFEATFKETTDALGYEIEPKIIDTVVGLNALDINTYQSCEGHTDRGRISPWVDFEAPNEPKKRYLKPERSKKEIFEESEVSDELLEKSKRLVKKINREIKKRNIESVDAKTSEGKKLAQELCEEYGISNQDLEKLTKGYDRVYKEKTKPTPEFIDWLKETEQMIKKVKDLIAEFNKDRDLPENLKIKVQPRAFGATIYNGTQDYETAEQDRTEEEKQKLAERLAQYQEEFKQFAEFLKEKFFQKDEYQN